MSAAATPTLILLLIDRHLAAWSALPGAAVRDQPVEGEPGWFPCAGADRLLQGLADLRERLLDELGGSPQLELLYDRASQPLLEAALPRLAQPLAGTAWQIQRWEHLAGPAAVAGSCPPRDGIAENLLPRLLATEDFEERERLREATRREHSGLAEQLQAERAQLQKENDDLRAQNAALRQVDGERLVTYLPALFPRVFSEIGGQDLALLTGRPQPYALPNPYPEPSPETLHVLQRQFRALPREHQRQIAAFIARLPQRPQLRPRPEMRDLIAELESE